MVGERLGHGRDLGAVLLAEQGVDLGQELLRLEVVLVERQGGEELVPGVLEPQAGAEALGVLDVLAHQEDATLLLELELTRVLSQELGGIAFILSGESCPRWIWHRRGRGAPGSVDGVGFAGVRRDSGDG